MAPSRIVGLDALNAQVLGTDCDEPCSSMEAIATSSTTRTISTAAAAAAGLMAASLPLPRY